MANPDEPTLKTFPIARAGAAETMRRAWGKLAERVAAADRPAFVGHRLGHEARYPRDLASAERVAGYDDVGALADAGLALGLDVLELDVRVLPDADERSVYVAHDPLPARDALPAPCRDYLERNTLAALLEHFAARGHHERGARLAIEIKTELADDRATWRLGEVEERLIGETAATIARAADGRSGGARLRRSLCFISFSLEALARMHEATGGAHEAFLIATTDQPGRTDLVRSLWRLEPFSDALAREVAASEWLAGVWFDPTFFVAPEARFGAIASARERALRLYVSTYYSRIETLVACFPGEARLPVEGMVFELE
jgi:hypothetical protein